MDILDTVYISHQHQVVTSLPRTRRRWHLPKRPGHVALPPCRGRHDGTDADSDGTET